MNASRSLSGTGTIDEQVLIVDPNGVAAMQMRLTNLTFTMPFNGTTLASPAVADTTQIIVIAPDGGVRGSAGTDGLGIPFFTLGLLPRGPIAPGMHWTSQVSGALPQVGITFGTSLPTIQLAADNVLTGLGQAHGQSVAVIDSAAHVRYKFSLGRGVYAATMGAAGTVTAHTLLGLTAGQPVMTRVHEDLGLSEQLSNSAGATRTWARHFVVDLTETLDFAFRQS